MNLQQYFDRVVVINLKRRPDRLARLKQSLQQCQWPFQEPEIFEAVDGRVYPPPPGWRSGPGAWGCKMSHQTVLGQAVADGVKTLLVMEDDVCFTDNFREDVAKFLSAVPEDWDQLMIGGQHLIPAGKPKLVKPGVLQCTSCERMHCYGIRGKFMQRFYERLQGGGKFNGSVHCDWILGRDPDMQPAHKVYAPQFFLAGQEGGASNIFDMMVPRRIWNPPGPELPVINLHAPAPVAAALSVRGFCTGSQIGPPGDSHYEKLCEIFRATRDNPSERVEKLRGWIKMMQWEVAADPSFVCTVWHPEATAELVKAASLWSVHEITAESIEEALVQLPTELENLR